MKAKIYRPSKSATQSGRAGRDSWVLEYEQSSPRRPDPLMGWTSADDTFSPVRIKFETQEAAQAFALSEGIIFSVIADHERKVKPRSYLDNFKFRQAEDAQ